MKKKPNQTPLSFVTTCMDPEDIKVNKVSKTEKDNSTWFHLQSKKQQQKPWINKNGLIDTEKKLMVSRAVGVGRTGLK